MLPIPAVEACWAKAFHPDSFDAWMNGRCLEASLDVLTKCYITGRLGVLEVNASECSRYWIHGDNILKKIAYLPYWAEFVYFLKGPYLKQRALAFIVTLIETSICIFYGIQTKHSFIICSGVFLEH